MATRFNDNDPEGDTVMVAAVNGSAANVGVPVSTNYGSVTMASNGSFVYTYNGSPASSDSFTYISTDGQDNSNTAMVTISIGAAQAPASLSVDGGSPVARRFSDAPTAASGEIVTYRGDSDLNQAVDFQDLVILASSYGQIDAGWGEGDFTGDGVVDDADLQLLKLNFGKTIDSESAVSAAFAGSSNQDEPDSDWWLSGGGVAEIDDDEEGLVVLLVRDND